MPKIYVCQGTEREGYCGNERKLKDLYRSDKDDTYKCRDCHGDIFQIYKRRYKLKK